MMSSLHSLIFSMSWRVLVEILTRSFMGSKMLSHHAFQLKEASFCPGIFSDRRPQATTLQRVPSTCHVNGSNGTTVLKTVTSRWNLLQTWPEFFASIMQITTASHVRQPHFCDNAIFKELGHSGKHMKDYDMDDHTFSFNSAASCWKTRLFAAIGWSLWQSKQWSSNCMMTMNYGLTQPMANL